MPWRRWSTGSSTNSPVTDCFRADQPLLASWTWPWQHRAARSPLRPSPQNLGWLLGTGQPRAGHRDDRRLRGDGHLPAGALRASTASTGELTQKELAHMVGLDKTTMVVTIDELEAAGLAERVPSPTDRRARIIAVTKAGRKAIAKGEKVVAADPGGRARGAPAREREAFMRASRSSSATGSPRRPRASGRRAAAAELGHLHPGQIVPNKSICYGRGSDRLPVVRNPMTETARQPPPTRALRALHRDAHDHPRRDDRERRAARRSRTTSASRSPASPGWSTPT